MVHPSLYTTCPFQRYIIDLNVDYTKEYIKALESIQDPHLPRRLETMRQLNLKEIT